MPLRLNNIDEIQRVLHGPQEGEKPAGMLDEIVIKCANNAIKTLNAAREVWIIALQQPEPMALTLEEWRKILPRWFVEKCFPEISQEEALRRRALPMEEKIRFAEMWSLDAWLFWLKPSERQWRWWSSDLIDDTTIRLRVVVGDTPFASGALKWLFKCSGAQFVE